MAELLRLDSYLTIGKGAASKLITRPTVIDKLTLRFGPQPGAAVLSFSPGPMTILVGPNNSGKSLALREVFHLARRQAPTPQLVIADLQWRRLDVAGCEVAFQRWMSFKNGHGPNVRMGFPEGDPRLLHWRQVFEQDASSQDDQVVFAVSAITSIMLDGRTRLSMATEHEQASLRNEPQTFLGVLLRNREKRAAVRQRALEAFGKHLVVDVNDGTVHLRLSNRPPEDDAEELSLTPRSLAFHDAAEPVQDASDGVKAYVGMLGTVISGDYRTVLVDEPEAFLHPPLARLLGQRLTEHAAAGGASIIAATHSADFLMGCVQSGRPVNIIRLTFEDGVATARLLPADEVGRLMRSPMLRSTGVLSGLFFKRAVVTEADGDRVFYQEINERLIADRQGGISDAAFLNVHSINSVPDIVGPLRRMGLPAAAIVDLDLITDEQGGTFTNLLRAVAVPEAIRQSLATLRAQIARAYAAQGVRPKEGGVAGLTKGADREAIEHLLERLGVYGIFPAPVGQLENWLPALGVAASNTIHGPRWVERIFVKMGDDPADAGYLRPATDGVWAFLNKVRAWTENPERKGLPER